MLCNSRKLDPLDPICHPISRKILVNSEAFVTLSRLAGASGLQYRQGSVHSAEHLIGILEAER